MALFGFGKKKEAEELVQCDCGGMCKASDVAAKKAEETEKAKADSGCCCGGHCNGQTIDAGRDRKGFRRFSQGAWLRLCQMQRTGSRDKRSAGRIGHERHHRPCE